MADTLSRVVLDTPPADLEVASVSSPPINFQQMAKAQLVDASGEGIAVRVFIVWPSPAGCRHGRLHLSMQCVPWPATPGGATDLAPPSVRPVSCFGTPQHPHYEKARFVWPGLNKDVGNWARTCLTCQRAKVQQHSGTASFPVVVSISSTSTLWDIFRFQMG